MHNSILLLIALATAMLAAHAAASQADVDRLTTAATAVLLRTRGEIEIAVFTLSQGPRFDLETPDLTATLTSEITESGNTSEAHAFFDSWDVETAAAIARARATRAINDLRWLERDFVAREQYFVTARMLAFEIPQVSNFVSDAWSHPFGKKQSTASLSRWRYDRQTDCDASRIRSIRRAFGVLIELESANGVADGLLKNAIATAESTPMVCPYVPDWLPWCYSLPESGSMEYWVGAARASARSVDSMAIRNINEEPPSSDAEQKRTRQIALAVLANSRRFALKALKSKSQSKSQCIVSWRSLP